MKKRYTTTKKYVAYFHPKKCYSEVNPKRGLVSVQGNSLPKLLLLIQRHTDERNGKTISNRNIAWRAVTINQHYPFECLLRIDLYHTV